MNDKRKNEILRAMHTSSVDDAAAAVLVNAMENVGEFFEVSDWDFICESMVAEATMDSKEIDFMVAAITKARGF